MQRLPGGRIPERRVRKSLTAWSVFLRPIRQYNGGRRGKIFKVHFRNLTAPLPHFAETFLDNGYMDMYQVMKALREVGFSGAIIPDHVPHTVGGSRVGNAYSIGYMRALVERAEEEG